MNNVPIFPWLRRCYAKLKSGCVCCVFFVVFSESFWGAHVGSPAAGCNAECAFSNWVPQPEQWRKWPRHHARLTCLSLTVWTVPQHWLATTLFHCRVFFPSCSKIFSRLAISSDFRSFACFHVFSIFSFFEFFDFSPTTVVVFFLILSSFFTVTSRNTCFLKIFTFLCCLTSFVVSSLFMFFFILSTFPLFSSLSVFFSCIFSFSHLARRVASLCHEWGINTTVTDTRTEQPHDKVPELRLWAKTHFAQTNFGKFVFVYCGQIWSTRGSWLISRPTTTTPTRRAQETNIQRGIRRSLHATLDLGAQARHFGRTSALNTGHNSTTGPPREERKHEIGGVRGKKGAKFGRSGGRGVQRRACPVEGLSRGRKLILTTPTPVRNTPNNKQNANSGQTRSGRVRPWPMETRWWSGVRGEDE